VYEAGDRLGGMMIQGIPEYRLPRELIAREAEAILELGVEARLNVRVGEDLAIGDLLAEHAALFVAVGTARGRDLEMRDSGHREIARCIRGPHFGAGAVGARIAVGREVFGVKDRQVLDMCAAPGGKTTHIAELMDNRGFITACDTDPRRLETVTTLAQRLRIKGIRTFAIPENGEPPAGPPLIGGVLSLSGDFAGPLGLHLRHRGVVLRRARDFRWFGP